MLIVFQDDPPNLDYADIGFEPGTAKSILPDTKALLQDTYLSQTMAAVNNNRDVTAPSTTTNTDFSNSRVKQEVVVTSVGSNNVDRTSSTNNVVCGSILTKAGENSDTLQYVFLDQFHSTEQTEIVSSMAQEGVDVTDGSQVMTSSSVSVVGEDGAAASFIQHELDQAYDIS